MSEQNGNAVILLAEDEPVVRNFVHTALMRAGYQVFSAADGAEAIQLSLRYEGRIDLLLTDVKMPRMVGPELARAILRERPRIRILLMTGESSGEIPEVLKPELLRKPFLPKHLLQRIEEALRSPNAQLGEI